MSKPIKFTREIIFHPAYDHRGQGRGNSGIGAAVAVFILSGPKGAITWDLATGWYVHTAEVGKPTPMMACYHKPRRVRKADRPAWKGGAPGCSVLNGRPCETDGTFCTEDIFHRLLTEGSEGVWQHLEGLYRSWLDPQPEEKQDEPA